MTFDSWKKNSAAIIVLLLVLVSIIVFGLMPQLRNLEEIKGKKLERESKRQAVEDRVSDLRKAMKEADSIEEVFQTVNGLWPDNEGVSKFIIQLEGLANENDLVLDSISIAEASLKNNTANTAADSSKKSSQTTKNKKEDDPPTKSTSTEEKGIRFSFNTRSSYENILNFISSMEKLARFNKIESISLSGDKDNQISLNLSGLIYGK